MAESGGEAPGGARFEAFGSETRIGGHCIAFTARTDKDTNALFVRCRDTALRVVGVNDIVDGRRVLTIRFGLDQGRVAVRLLFADGSQGLYVADLPSLSPIPIAVLCDAREPSEAEAIAGRILVEVPSCSNEPTRPSTRPSAGAEARW